MMDASLKAQLKVHPSDIVAVAYIMPGPDTTGGDPYGAQISFFVTEAEADAFAIDVAKKGGVVLCIRGCTSILKKDEYMKMISSFEAAHALALEAEASLRKKIAEAKRSAMYSLAASMLPLVIAAAVALYSM